MQTANKLVLLAAVILLTHGFAIADEPLDTIQNVAHKDVVAIAYADLNAVKINEAVKWSVAQGITPPEAAKQLKPMTMMAKGMLDQLIESGASHVVVLLEQDDLTMQRPPLFAITVAPGKDVKTASGTLGQVVGMMRQPNFQVEDYKGCILVGSSDQIALAKQAESSSRPDLAKAWKQFGGHDAGAMVFGSSDSRRVVRELFPKLESPFEKITGAMIADNLVSAGLAITLPDNPHAKLVFQTTDPSSAKTLQEAALAGKNMLSAQQGKVQMGMEMLARAAMNLEPKIAGNDVVVDMDALLTNGDKLMKLLSPIREEARRTQRMNNLKQIMLAMHNYAEAFKSLPARANVDKDGKPLLSWRVHILPFLAQGELYKKFKLDEPWDSPHNIKLAKEMPLIYADPSSASQDENQNGRTRYLVPVAKDSIFSSTEGVRFRDIKDGTSNTIAVVCVPGDSSVVWTKPADWDVNATNPKQGLFGSDDTASVGICDGSVRTIEASVSNEVLNAMLTKSGGEVIPR